MTLSPQRLEKAAEESFLRTTLPLSFRLFYPRSSTSSEKLL